MTEPGQVLVGSNVVIDIIRNDPDWMNWSLSRLAEYPHPGHRPLPHLFSNGRADLSVKLAE